MTQRRIVCAAMRSIGGSIICSPRHWDIIARNIAEHTIVYWPEAEQGFVDQHGEFLTREQAWLVALEAGQILHRVGGDEGCLYSENLY